MSGSQGPANAQYGYRCTRHFEIDQFFPIWAIVAELTTRVSYRES
jgi:hypothetical protein